MSKIEPVYSNKDQRHFIIRWGERIFAVVATFLVWYFIIENLYYKLTVEAGERLWTVIDIMILTFIITIILMSIWQLYNWLMFRNKKRRKGFPHQSLEHVGLLYGISGEDMWHLQDIRKAAVVEFENHRYYYKLDGGKSIEIKTLRRKSDVEQEENTKVSDASALQNKK